MDISITMLLLRSTVGPDRILYINDFQKKKKKKNSCVSNLVLSIPRVYRSILKGRGPLLPSLSRSGAVFPLS